MSNISSSSALDASSSSESVSLIWDLLVSDPKRTEAVQQCPALALSLVQTMLVPSSQRWWERRAQLRALRDPSFTGGEDVMNNDPFAEVFLQSSSRNEALEKISELAAGTSALSTFAAALQSAIDFMLGIVESANDGGSDDGITAKRLTDINLEIGYPQWLCAPAGKAKEMEDSWVEAAFQAGKSKLKSICHMLLDNASASSTSVFGGRASAVVQLIQYAGLTSSTNTRLTGAGMGFCMAEAVEQYATLVQGAARVVAATTGVTMDVVLRHIAIIGQADTNRYALPFPSKAASPVLHALLMRLVDIGVVYPIANSGEHYFVTAAGFGLALLARGTSSPVMNRMLADHDASHSLRAGAARAIRSEDEDTIITETNFRLYAYTRNPTLLRVLDQFTEHDTVVDDWLVCCKLTRDSFVSAVRRGITAQQVLEFLALKAHPVMRRKAAAAGAAEIVPQSIADQLRMWESDCRRVTIASDTVLLSGLSSTQRLRILEEIVEHGYQSTDAVLYDDLTHTLVVRGVVYDAVLHPLLTGETPT